MTDGWPRRGTFVAAAIGAALVLSAATCAVDTAVFGTSGPTTDLGDLAVAPESHAESYERDAFGTRWKDVDRNGCGQRDDVLARDLRGATFRSRCVVVGGTLVDPYTGVKVVFSKARADQVQIDHRVALAEAWRSGAWGWAPDKRERFANDLDNLSASAGAVNREKSDLDAKDWLPQGRDRRCDFSTRVITIKVRYGLSADRAEADALSRALGGCPAPSSPAATPGGAPAASPAP